MRGPVPPGPSGPGPAAAAGRALLRLRAAGGCGYDGRSVVHLRICASGAGLGSESGVWAAVAVAVLAVVRARSRRVVSSYGICWHAVRVRVCDVM
jgi:hypothetical protein